MCKYYLEVLQEETVGRDLAPWIEHSIAAQFPYEFQNRCALKPKSVPPPTSGKIYTRQFHTGFVSGQTIAHSVVSADFQKIVNKSFDEYSFPSQTITLHTHTRTSGFQYPEEQGLCILICICIFLCNTPFLHLIII